ncbi:MAG: VWA domain-containing protein [Candidatus Norongarragalinales archaeon]
MVEWRKGIVFTLDAGVAFLLLVSVSAVVLLFSSVSIVPQAVQENLHLKASDSVSVLSFVQVRDARREAPVALLFDSGVVGVESLNETLMQLVADLWASGDAQNLSRAQNITDFFLSRFFPAGSNYAVYASNQSISNRTPSGDYSVATVSRNFVSGISSNRSLAVGCVARAFVQKIRGKEEAAITYFGGFEGEGNITAVVRGVPAGANVSRVSIEANAGTNFSLSLNGVNCGTLNKTSGLYDVNEWTFSTGTACLNAAVAGADNVFEFNFTGENLSLKYFGGGFVKITYNTTDLAPTQSGFTRYYFNGVDGVINYYSSFYIPGNITQITGSLHLLNNYTTFLTIGNKTVYEDNGTNESRIVSIPNSNFSGAFPDYREISLKTVPLRLGTKANLTGRVGNADVVLITDVSGSMDWRMDQDGVSGTARNCNDPLLYDDSTKRISVAKCVDQNFVQKIFEGVGNRVALVSFSAGISNYTEFTNDTVYLNNTINSYPAGGGTCIACAINKAFELIAQQSPVGNNRTKHVIVMSDGVANYRGAGWCALDDAESSGLEYFPGDWGGFVHYDPFNASNWTDYSYGGSNDVFSIAPLNSSFAVAAGLSGKFFGWNGTGWSETQDTGSHDFYGISLLNSTFGFAVGTSGKIYQLNGGSWVQNTDQGSQTYRSVSAWDASSNVLIAGYSGSTGQLLKWNGGTSWTLTSVSNYQFYDVKHVNSSWAFAVGSSGKIYRWNGANWAEYQDTGSQTWRALSVINSSAVYVAGSGGAIYRWDGTSFASFASPTSTQINGISFYNDSLGKIATSNGLIYAYSEGAWALARDARYTGTLSRAADCNDADSCGTAFSRNYAAQNANWSSCRLRQYLNSTNYAVGFGPVSTCALGNTTLSEIAKCGNGTFFASSNASELAQFYTSLAQAIVQQSNTSQTVTIVGGVQASLYPDSYLDFVFDPQYYPPYQSISISRSANLSTCQGPVNTPVNFSIYDFRIASYSADRWTSNVSTTNALLGLNNVFNLSAYNSTSYFGVGDPFPVQINPVFIQQGAVNTIDVRTAFSPYNESALCSTNNSVRYSGWVNGSVGYGAFFPYCFARNVTVHYDLDGDNLPDGSVNVQIGGTANETAINTSQLNQNGNNAIEDAFLRLLLQLDLNTSGGAPGMQTNPIDVALAEDVVSTLISNSGLPALNSTDFSVVVWR